MGCSPFKKTCSSNPTEPKAVAPNPSPYRWKLLEVNQLRYAYVLKVQYLDCTNFEGIKIMVYEGKYSKVDYLDPHFFDNKQSPIARFKPDKKGWNRAIAFAQVITP